MPLRLLAATFAARAQIKLAGAVAVTDILSVGQNSAAVAAQSTSLLAARVDVVTSVDFALVSCRRRVVFFWAWRATVSRWLLKDWASLGLGWGMGMGLGLGTASSSGCGAKGGRPYDLISNSLAISTICMPVINTL